MRTARSAALVLLVAALAVWEPQGPREHPGVAARAAGAQTSPAAAPSPGGQGSQVRTTPIEPKTGGTLVLAVTQDIDTLNPLLQTYNVAGLVSDAVYDPLVRLGADGQYHAALALRVPTRENGGLSRDGLTYTFPLRANVKFHDGHPLTCEDVRYTWSAGKNPKVRVVFREEFTAVEGVTCSDAHTAVFRLARPYPALLNAAAKYGILPKHLYGDDDLNTSELNLRPVGSGPFVLKEYVKGSHVVLEANPTYFRGRPRLDRVVVKIVLDENALLAQLERGEVDVWWRMGASKAPIIRDLPDWNLVSVPILGQLLLYWNVSKDARLGDRRVRHAIAHAVDGQAIIRLVYLGYGRPNPANPLVPTHWLFDPQVRTYPHDPVRARATLDEAGWRPGPDGVRTKNGQRLSFSLTTAGEDHLKAAELVAAQLKQVGIEVRIRPGLSATNYRERQELRFELSLGRYGQQFETDLRYLLATGGAENFSRWSNAEADRAMEQAAATADPEKKQQLYRRVQKLFAEELPYLPLMQLVSLYAVKKSVHNFRPNPYMLNAISDFWNVSEWWKE
jgi:peptide/nickel transport system substrate-binding protein